MQVEVVFFGQLLSQVATWDRGITQNQGGIFSEIFDAVDVCWVISWNHHDQSVRCDHVGFFYVAVFFGLVHRLGVGGQQNICWCTLLDLVDQVGGTGIVDGQINWWVQFLSFLY